ncbi:MAG: AI-2E family transporter [Oscillospiraceae bacterium]|nr:AI-2E family transporter [Oscillospiraceae bacterium]
MDKKTIRTILFTAFIAAALAALAIKPEFFLGILSKAAGLLMPIFIGAAIAFVINIPAMKLPRLYLCLFKGIKEKTVNILSVATAYILLIGVLVGIVWIIVPQLISSVKVFFDNFDEYYSNFIGYCERLEQRDTLGIFAALRRALEGFTEGLPDMLEKAAVKSSDIVSGAARLLVGFVFSIYILMDKENLRKGVSLIAKRYSGERYETVCRRYRMVYDTFSRFVVGQISEAIILGVLCYIGMKIFRFEYALLISTIIGVTALIPVVGAIAGTVPSALLIFLISPIRAVWFVVFIIVLQQLENNLIYPRVVGKNLGIPPVLVLLAIMLGAGLGGAAGMLLGVPLMSLAYALLREKLTEEN